MPSLGFGELLVVGVLLLLVVGPERLPHATRTLGRLYGRMRRAADELRRAMVLEADRLDEEERLRELRRRRERELDEERGRREAELGGHAQPEAPAEAAPSQASEEAPIASTPALPRIPAGLSEAEWNELPAHIRELVLRRRSET